MDIARKLEHIHQSLSLLTEQEEAVKLLVIENAQKINGLVEDICEALLEYQVCIVNHSLPTESEVWTRLHFKRTSIKMVVRTLLV